MLHFKEKRRRLKINFDFVYVITLYENIIRHSIQKEKKIKLSFTYYRSFNIKNRKPASNIIIMTSMNDAVIGNSKNI